MTESSMSADTLSDLLLSEMASRQLIAITALELVLNDACNLACTYCFEGNKTARRHMSHDVGRRAVDFLLTQRTTLRKEIYFFGGEPLLSWDLIKGLTNYARERDPCPESLGIALTTNGTILPKEATSFFVKNNVGVLLSLDPGKHAHDRHRIFRNGKGSFDAAWHAMGRLLDEGVHASVRITVMPDSTDGLYEFVDTCCSSEVRNIIIGPAVPAAWTKESIASLELQLEKISNLEKRIRREGGITQIKAFEDYGKSSRYCYAGSTLIAVSPEGGIYGCSRLMLNNNGAGIERLGALGDKKFDQKAHLNIINGTKLSGCAAVNFDENGDILVTSASLLMLDEMFRRVSVKHYSNCESSI